MSVDGMRCLRQWDVRFMVNDEDDRGGGSWWMMRMMRIALRPTSGAGALDTVRVVGLRRVQLGDKRAVQTRHRVPILVLDNERELDQPDSRVIENKHLPKIGA